MKAHEYFKKHGFRKCKSDCAVNAWLNTGFWIQLKRLVESHELVKEHGSLDRAKMYAESLYTAPEVVERMQQAITDVESCM